MSNSTKLQRETVSSSGSYKYIQPLPWEHVKETCLISHITIIMFGNLGAFRISTVTANVFTRYPLVTYIYSLLCQDLNQGRIFYGLVTSKCFPHLFRIQPIFSPKYADSYGRLVIQSGKKLKLNKIPNIQSYSFVKEQNLI